MEDELRILRFEIRRALSRPVFLSWSRNRWKRARAYDQLFTEFNIVYNTYDNQFFRAEIAEILLKQKLFVNKSFRECEDSLQGDFEWMKEDGVWIPVSIKYAGRLKGGKAPVPSDQVSGLGWGLNESGMRPEELECMMLVIWDTDKGSSGTATCAFDRGLCLITPESFNSTLAEYPLIEPSSQNRTGSAFRFHNLLPSLNNERNWIRFSGRPPEILNPEGWRAVIQFRPPDGFRKTNNPRV